MVETQRKSTFGKNLLQMFLHPVKILKNEMDNMPWPYSILISGVTFLLFFLQTGLDMRSLGTITTSKVILIALLGLVYGTLGVALMGVLAWAVCNSFHGSKSLGWSISALALSYSTSFIYIFLGLVASLVFGWKTSIAFGVTGVLWALRPVMATLRIMTGDKVALSLIMSSIYGILVLLVWTLMGMFSNII